MTTEHEVTLYELQRHAEEARDRIACVASDLLALAGYLEDAGNQPRVVDFVATEIRCKAEELAG
jgi:hypothetical protein